jgi:hypothetical protein
LRPDREVDRPSPPAPTAVPLRHALVPLQRRQIRSPAQALSNIDVQLKHARSSRTIVSLVGFI